VLNWRGNPLVGPTCWASGTVGDGYSIAEGIPMLWCYLPFWWERGYLGHVLYE